MFWPKRLVPLQALVRVLVQPVPVLVPQARGLVVLLPVLALLLPQLVRVSLPLRPSRLPSPSAPLLRWVRPLRRIPRRRPITDTVCHPLKAMPVGHGFFVFVFPEASDCR